MCTVDKIQSVSCLLQAKYPFSCFDSAASLSDDFPLPLPTIHVSFCPRFTFTPPFSAASTSLYCHHFLLSCVLPSVAWGFLPNPREEEARAKAWWAQSCGCGWAHNHLPPGHPSLHQPAFHKDSKTQRDHRLQGKTEMNLDALFKQIQFTEKQAREKRSLIQQGLPCGLRERLRELGLFSCKRGD